MKYKCKFIIPYFGQFNNYFQLFLNSCAHNSKFQWLILTDDRTCFAYPENVEVKYTTFKDLKRRIQAMYDFPITLHKPYKLCDYRMAYGDIFVEELRDVQFWGFCDADLIWGDIEKFISDDILDRYDRIFNRGHLTLLRNKSHINKLYRQETLHMPIDYRFAFTTKYCCHFDEFYYWDNVFTDNKIKTYYADVIADVDCDKWQFNIVGKNDILKMIFLWDKGSLTRYYLENDKLLFDDWCYIHLQKRMMNNTVLEKNDKYYILPNKFINYNDTPREVLTFGINGTIVDKLYLKRRWKRLKEIAINIKNGALNYRRKELIFKISTKFNV